MLSAESRRTGRHESEDRSIEYCTIAILSLSVNSEIRQIQHCATRGAPSLTKYPREPRTSPRLLEEAMSRVAWSSSNLGLSIVRPSSPANVPAYRNDEGKLVRVRSQVARQRKVDCTIACGRITAYVRRVHATRSRPHRALGETKVPRDVTLDGGAYAAPCTPR